VRRMFLFTAAGLLSALWLCNASARDAASKKPAETCNGDFGTTVHFEATPSAAARKALKEHKLVCVLHVSGLFENPDFT
jgi:hypothetical protein